MNWYISLSMYMDFTAKGEGEQDFSNIPNCTFNEPMGLIIWALNSLNYNIDHFTLVYKLSKSDT